MLYNTVYYQRHRDYTQLASPAQDHQKKRWQTRLEEGEVSKGWEHMRE